MYYSIPVGVGTGVDTPWKRQSLYWANITPDLTRELTPEQKEGAVHITAKDVIACAVLPLSELNLEDDSYPDHFVQSDGHDNDRAALTEAEREISR